MFKGLFESEGELGISMSETSPAPTLKGKRVTIEILEIFGFDTSFVLKLPNPYVLVLLNDHKHYRTKTRQHGHNQAYYESFDVQNGNNQVLRLQVFDTGRLGTDTLLGEVEIPLQSLYLEEGVSKYKSIPVPNSVHSRIQLKLMAKGFAQTDPEYTKKEQELEAELKKKKKHLNHTRIKEKRSQKDVKPYYQVLEVILQGKDDMIALQKLKTLIAEIEESLSVYKKNENFILKVRDALKGLKTILSDKRGVDEGDLPDLAHLAGVPLVECLGDVVHALGQILLRINKTDAAYEFLLQFETEFYEHPDIARLLDQIEAHRLKTEKYAFLHGQRIHLATPYKSNPWPKELPKEIPACFFSWVVYEPRPRWMFGRVWNEKVDPRLTGYGNWTISTQFNVSDWQIGFECIFSLNHELDTVILAVRGTESEKKMDSLNQWISNLDYHLTDFPIENGVKLHKGFLDQFLSCKDVLLEQVTQYLKRGHKIIITGHSRGAAIATIIAYFMGVYFGGMATQNITVITFGSPRVGNMDFSKSFNRIYPSAKRFVSHHKEILDVDDMVTELPPSELGFHHVGIEHKVYGESKYFGNPQVIPGIGEPYDLDYHKVLKHLTPVLLHSQQVYMDGLIDAQKKK